MRVVSIAVALASGLALTACGGDTVSSAPVPVPPAHGAPPTAFPAVSGLETRARFAEDDFAENDHNRDPFRSYASVIEPPTEPRITYQLRPILPQYAVDELKLVAIVLAGDYPRAMVLDPNGKGWVVKKGDYLGRADTVHTGGVNGTDTRVNWRVDRVREGELVLAREDRSGVERTATKVIPLHIASEAEREQRL